jgi:hypothetical protein
MTLIAAEPMLELWSDRLECQARRQTESGAGLQHTRNMQKKHKDHSNFEVNNERNYLHPG